MNSLIKLIVIVLIFLAVVSYSAQAGTMYVTDVLRITVREGNGLDYKITDVLESGQDVEVISSDDEWAKVRLPNGKEGWLIGKYLTSQKPGGAALKKLQEKEALLNTQNSALRTENNQLRDELKNINLQLAESKQALFVTKKSFETIKDNPDLYIELETKYKEAQKKLSLQKNKIENLEDEFTRLLRQQNVMWLLAGAGILLVGFLIGYSARRNKNRSSLL
ncbi:MAG: TIGR04211 family SH3 domain-containing protein [Proteobacteria bacterium]|nr:TIGR04211 family SH3 domain-containing protein [Pseudomonadota bacterium]MBU1713686.1 TIGR04211 family SH3 domain-containing protein [Pseudomonadota bacterium]